MSARRVITHAALEFIHRITSRKLWTFLLCMVSCWLGLERGVNHLYSLPPASVNVYGGMFLCVMGAITAMACKYMGIENVSVSAATSVSGLISAAAERIDERRESHEVIETIEHVVEEGAPGAPARRPFAPDDHEEGL